MIDRPDTQNNAWPDVNHCDFGFQGLIIIVLKLRETSRIRIQPFTEISSVLYDLIRGLMVWAYSSFTFFRHQIHLRLRQVLSIEAAPRRHNPWQPWMAIFGVCAWPYKAAAANKCNRRTDAADATLMFSLGYSAVHLCTSYSVRNVLDCSACMPSFPASSLSHWSLLQHLWPLPPGHWAWGV